MGVLSNRTPGDVHRNPWVTQTLPKESFELNPKQKSHCLALMHMLVPTKADHITKEHSCNWGMVRSPVAGRIYQSDLHTFCWPAGSGRLAWAWRKESVQNIVIIWRAFLVYLAGAKAGTGAFKGPALLGAGVPRTVFPRLSSLSRLAYSAEWSDKGLCKSEVPLLWNFEMF